MFVTDCYKKQQLCDKTVDNYPQSLEFVPGWYKTQKISDKAVNTHPYIIQFVPECYETLKICGIVVSLYHFLIVYHTNKYKTQKCLMKLWWLSSSIEICSWLVQLKWLKIFYTVLFADEFLVFFDKDSSNAIFCCNEMSFRTVNLNNINLDNNFEEGNPDTIIVIRLLSWHGKFKNAKHFKKKSRINSNSVASYRMVEFLYVRRWEKRKRFNFYLVMLLMWISSIQIERTEIFWDRKLYTKTSYSSQFFLNIFSFWHRNL